MAERVSFIVELIDRISGPERKAVAAIGGLSGSTAKALGTIDGGVKKVGRGAILY